MLGKATRSIIKNIFGFIFFLALLLLANLLAPRLGIVIFQEVVIFLNNNLAILFLMTVITIIGDIFWSLYFPLSIPAPVASAVLSILTINLVYRLWNLVDSFAHTGVTIPVDLLYRFIPLIVLIGGYLLIFARMGMPKDAWKEHAARPESRAGPDRRERKGDVGWDDVAEEYKMVLYNVGRTINSSLEKGEKETKKAKK